MKLIHLSEQQEKHFFEGALKMVSDVPVPSLEHVPFSSWSVTENSQNAHITGVVRVAPVRLSSQPPWFSEKHISAQRFHFLIFATFCSDRGIQSSQSKLPKLLCACSTLQLPSWRGQHHQQGTEKRSSGVSSLFRSSCLQLPDGLRYLPLCCSPGESVARR